MRTLLIVLKKFDKKHRNHERMITVPKRPLVFVLPYHGPLSFETKTILRKFFNSILICCKLLRLRIKTLYQTLFVLNITFPKSLHLVLFINFSVDSAMNHNYDRKTP